MLGWFDIMTEKDVASWNIMITGYGMHGHGDEALDIFFSYVSSPIGTKRNQFCWHGGGRA